MQEICVQDPDPSPYGSLYQEPQERADESVLFLPGPDHTQPHMVRNCMVFYTLHIYQYNQTSNSKVGLSQKLLWEGEKPQTNHREVDKLSSSQTVAVPVLPPPEPNSKQKVVRGFRVPCPHSISHMGPSGQGSSGIRT